jgi:hypothetical protein
MQTSRLISCLLLLLVGFGASIELAPAQENASVEAYRPITDADVRQAQATLRQAHHEFRSVVADPALVAGWEKFLSLPQLSEIEVAGKNYSDDDALDTLAVNLAGDIPGMEFPQLQNLRQAILTFADRWRDRDDENLETEATAKVARGRLLAASTMRTPQEQAELASLACWLSRHGQAPRLLAALQQQSRAPNLVLKVDKRFLSAYMRESIDRPEEVNDEILGTTITGTGQAVGFADVELIPDPNRLAFDIVANVCVRTTTTGVNGPVCILSSGATGIVTRKTLYFDGKQLTSAPARSSASTQSETLGIGTKFKRLANRLITRIAEKEIEKKKDEGNAIAASHAERDANIATDEDVAGIVRETNAELQKEVFIPMERRGFVLRNFHCATDAAAIAMKLGVGSQQQLLAPAAPVMPPTSSDVTFQIHPTTISNVAATYLGGDWYWLSDLAEPSKSGGGKLLDGKLGDLEKDRSSDIGFMLDRFSPITASFENDEIRVAIRGERFVAQQQEWPAMEITLHLRPAFSENGALLVLTKEPEVFPPGKTKGLSGREIALRRILMTRLKKELERPIDLKPLKIERDERLLGHLQLECVKTIDGWLEGGLKFVPTPSE